MEDLEFTELSLLDRLERLTGEGLVHPSWVQNLDKYGLLYAATRSSGLTLDDINSVDDETFINRVNWGMLEWDL